VLSSDHIDFVEACGALATLVAPKAMSRAQARIRDAVTRNKQGKVTALLHHISSIDVLRASLVFIDASCLRPQYARAEISVGQVDP
jgi:hypothetical protein